VSSPRVLIIDSDNVRRGMVACTLPGDRYGLEFAKSAERGLDLLGQLQPDVIVVGRDAGSRALCQRIRSLPAGVSCRLVLMDEQFRDEGLGRAEAEAAGADAFLPFPFESELFDDRLRASRGPSTPPQAPVAPPRAGDEEWSAFRERVGFFAEHLEELDYYQLLEIGGGASAATIKEAYFRCSMELHPDRFLQLEDEALRAQIYEVFKRMTEAFKVLINPEARSQYDALLASERASNLRYLDRPRIVTSEDPTSDAATPAGKKYLHFANLAGAEGNLRSARMYLTLALRCEPHNAALRGRLEAMTRRLGD